MKQVRNEIRFLLNEREVRLKAVTPGDTLLDYLRLVQSLRGTKEGCAEGDCGACTVLIGRLKEESLVYEPVNACIRLLGSVDGCHVVTIEHLSAQGGKLHPVQKAMVERHASQCGFCTPGIVMSLYALWMANPSPGDEDIEVALQGNLCRCTGYQPIFDAAKAAVDYDARAQDRLYKERETVTGLLRGFEVGARVEITHDSKKLILPASAQDLAEILADEPEATIVAGATDVGLWVTKLLRDISPAIFIAHLEELKRVEVDESGVTLGAGVSYSESAPVLLHAFPHLAGYWRRIGGWQVRNQGTIGGNIANGSPIGDTPPPLIALGANLILRAGGERRTIPLENFFIDYGKQDRKPGEFVEAVHIPHIAENTRHAAYKISKRRDEDISALCAAFNVRLLEGKVAAARIAYGGMAATPKRAKAVEAALIGKPWTEGVIQKAQNAFVQDFAPITDWRASAEYRMLAARNLLMRFFLENSQGGSSIRLPRDQEQVEGVRG